ncbi:MAG: hypothetical protein GVY24_04835 [Planctomycetes bacterium]|nr:hypothetical protein [Planctomycetota bacterium]
MHKAACITVNVNGHVRRAVIERLHPRVLALLRGKTAQQRVAMADRLISDTRRAMYQRIAREHPDWSDGQVRLEMIRRCYGVDL